MFNGFSKAEIRTPGANLERSKNLPFIGEGDSAHSMGHEGRRKKLLGGERCEALRQGNSHLQLYPGDGVQEGQRGR